LLEGVKLNGTVFIGERHHHEWKSISSQVSWDWQVDESQLGHLQSEMIQLAAYNSVTGIKAK